MIFHLMLFCCWRNSYPELTNSFKLSSFICFECPGKDDRNCIKHDKKCINSRSTNLKVALVDDFAVTLWWSSVTFVVMHEESMYRGHRKAKRAETSPSLSHSEIPFLSWHGRLGCAHTPREKNSRSKTKAHASSKTCTNSTCSALLNTTHWIKKEMSKIQTFELATFNGRSHHVIEHFEGGI